MRDHPLHRLVVLRIAVRHTGEQQVDHMLCTPVLAVLLTVNLDPRSGESVAPQYERGHGNITDETEVFYVMYRYTLQSTQECRYVSTKSK